MTFKTLTITVLAHEFVISDINLRTNNCCEWLWHALIVFLPLNVCCFVYGFSTNWFWFFSLHFCYDMSLESGLIHQVISCMTVCCEVLFSYTFLLSLSLSSSRGLDICLSSSLLLWGTVWSTLSNLNLRQSLITPFGPADSKEIPTKYFLV